MRRKTGYPPRRFSLKPFLLRLIGEVLFFAVGIFFGRVRCLSFPKDVPSRNSVLGFRKKITKIVTGNDKKGVKHVNKLKITRDSICLNGVELKHVTAYSINIAENAPDPGYASATISMDVDLLDLRLDEFRST